MNKQEALKESVGNDLFHYGQDGRVEFYVDKIRHSGELDTNMAYGMLEGQQEMVFIVHDLFL